MPARTRELGAWLDDVEKVVFSHTLTDLAWSNARLATRPLEESLTHLRRRRAEAEARHAHPLAEFS